MVHIIDIHIKARPTLLTFLFVVSISFPRKSTMYDELTIACTPLDEPCVQVGSDLYGKWARKECRAFLNQCYRLLDASFEVTEVSLRIVSFPHDFGSYMEVVARYNEESEAACEQAFWLEANTPQHWDKQARLELTKEYFADIKKSTIRLHF
jgi:hypothetical protein